MYIEPVQEQEYISYLSLIKNNNGFFKSLKQKNFFNKHLSWETEDRLTKYGVPVKTGQAVVEFDGLYTWANYGSASKIPVIISFVFNENGIVSKWTTGGQGNLRDGWSPDPMKCKNKWTIDASVTAPVYEEIVVDKAPSAWIGQPGQRIEKIVTVTFMKEIGYNQWGTTYLSKLEDEDGNEITAWKYIGQKGEKFRIRATVKGLDEYQGRKQTVITRVSVLDKITEIDYALTSDE